MLCNAGLAQSPSQRRTNETDDDNFDSRRDSSGRNDSEDSRDGYNSRPQRARNAGTSTMQGGMNGGNRSGLMARGGGGGGAMHGGADVALRTGPLARLVAEHTRALRAAAPNREVTGYLLTVPYSDSAPQDIKVRALFV